MKGDGVYGWRFQLTNGWECFDSIPQLVNAGGPGDSLYLNAMGGDQAQVGDGRIDNGHKPSNRIHINTDKPMVRCLAASCQVGMCPNYPDATCELDQIHKHPDAVCTFDYVNGHQYCLSLALQVEVGADVGCCNYPSRNLSLMVVEHSGFQNKCGIRNLHIHFFVEPIMLIRETDPLKVGIKRVINDQLLLGRVVRTTTVGVKQLPCSSVRVPLNEYSEYIKKYFVYSKDFWAYDKARRVKLGDIVLIRRMDHPLTVKVSHEIEKICFEYGKIVDPLTNKRIIDDLVIGQKLKGNYKEIIDWKNVYVKEAIEKGLNEMMERIRIENELRQHEKVAATEE
uniref:Mitochondrial ribosomal protein S17 n=1 Tax=Romanomermis culicivorax TaxID=13658 RepID=A0A915I3H4_ROMCU